jgi:hypothetical protein
MKVKRIFTYFALVSIIIFIVTVDATAQRKFVHPGIGYTQSDLDRMKAMIDAKQEPFYSSFLALKSDTYSSITRSPRTWSGMTDKSGNKMITSLNNTVGYDGRCATQYALIWRLTGDETYAKKAVSFLNAYIGLKNSPSSGTAPLDNGKIYLLLEAAELMRDYSGWATTDQQAFKDMLVYPCYSSKVNMAKQICTETGKTYSYWDSATGDTLNRVTFYWNILNGDPMRHGNQGMFALRGLMAMGIYLDNDTIYDRTYRKFMSMPHRSDDLPYPTGAPIQGNLNTGSTTQWFNYYNVNANTETGSIADYGYDDELKYYIYENGQMEESSRDQAHAVCGIVMAENIAHIAWSQGDDIYSQYDNRLLKGINWTWRYNYSWYNNAIASNRYWSGEDTWEPTVASGEFKEMTDRTMRWQSLKVNPYGENKSTSSDGTKYWAWTRGEKAQLQTQMLMHYKVISPTTVDSLKWMQRAYNIMVDSLGYERGYKDTGHFYEFLGWGGLLDYRTIWMAGSGGKFIDKKFIPALPSVPCTIKAVDYDFYNDSTSGNGHTFYHLGMRTDTNYRIEGGMDILQKGNDFVLTNMKGGEWMDYTFTTATATNYQISVSAKVNAKGVAVGFALDNGSVTYAYPDVNTDYTNNVLGNIKMSAGAHVLRIYIQGTDDAVELKNIQIELSSVDTVAKDYRWNSRDYAVTSGSGSFLTDESDQLLTSTSYASTTSPTFGMYSSTMAYTVSSKSLYFLIHGNNLDHALFKKAVYRQSNASTDMTKSSTTGQGSTWIFTGLGDDGDNTILIWKLDSSVSSRITPLLKACYTDGSDSYTLKGLGFTVYGTNLHLSTKIDNASFYTLDEILATYPELKSTPLSIAQTETSIKNKKSDYIFKCDGIFVRKINQNMTSQDAIDSLSRGIYILDGKKIIKP